MRYTKILLAAVLLALVAAVPVGAQTALSTTTLSAAVTSTTGNIPLTSVTSVTVGSYLYVDKELMKVLSITGSVAGVRRGVGPSRADAHASGATVYLGTYDAFPQGDPVGPCTSTSWAYTPYVATNSGNLYTCTDSKWTLAKRFPESSPSSGDGVLRWAEVSLTNAEIKGMRAAPKTLVAAPGAGKVLEFVSAVLILDYGSNVLTRPNADEDMVVKYENGAGLVASEASVATFPPAAADDFTKLNPVASSLLTKAGAENKALVLHNDGTAEFGGNAGNDTTLRVKVAYRVWSTGW